MMILVRDDDTNATTDPGRIERTYAPLLDAGVHLNFAVIPEAALDTAAPDGTRERYLDAAAGSLGNARMAADAPMAVWLKEHASQASVMMHGLTHARGADGTEFGLLGSLDARARLVRGLQVMLDAFGAAPRAFVAPWDALSRDALVAACDGFDLVSTGWVDRRRLPASAWPAHALERLAHSHALRVGHSWVLRHAGCRIVQDSRADHVGPLVKELTRTAEIAVIVLHHWMYWDHSEPHPALRALAAVLRGTQTLSVAQALLHLDALPGLHALQAVRSRFLPESRA